MTIHNLSDQYVCVCVCVSFQTPWWTTWLNTMINSQHHAMVDVHM